MNVKGLTFTYGKNEVFRDFYFRSDSPITALSGPSGCGKTTLLKILSGNLEAPDAIIEADQRHVLLVLQEDSMLPWLTGYENLRLTLGKAEEYLINHNLYPLVKPYLNEKAFEMSYGQRRLLEIFRAIVAKPSILMLDEPFNFLDKEFRKAVVSSLLTLSKMGTKIIFSSHYNDDHHDLNASVHSFEGKFPVKRLTGNN